MPVYNGGDDIVENVDVIRRAVAGGLPGEEVELIVVSDGSIDGTAERLLESRSDRDIRVIHYDRNLGKGYAVKAGALAAHGDWVALIDHDLDLDPASIPEFLDVARREQLDFAIGSKRHPGSTVQYPRSRRIASWCYQQLNRMLFRLDVRDTQVGLKVFSRQVVDEVVPLLLVKRFAFDLELLAVATALGRGRIEELPVRLEYRFSGSALRSSAVLRALWDTAAIFYRLRILRTYQRKRGLVGAAARPDRQPLVSVIGDHGAATALDYPRLEPVSGMQAASGELVAVLGARARPAGNWIAAAVPFFGHLFFQRGCLCFELFGRHTVTGQPGDLRNRERIGVHVSVESRTKCVRAPHDVLGLAARDVVFHPIVVAVLPEQSDAGDELALLPPFVVLP